MGPFPPGLKTATTGRQTPRGLSGIAASAPPGARSVPAACLAAAVRVTLHPAIFTSMRTPTGEGYRIIACARALRPDEKQTITRLSPSHEALCSNDPGAIGVASYPLPGGRVCIAYSRFAGLEHTGRRGFRVYTYNMVLDDAAFRATGYNPFAIIRAALDADLTRPLLKPPDALEPVELNVAQCTADDGAFPSAASGTEWKKAALSAVLKGRRVAMCAEGLATETAEVLWMSLPGPLRARWSFSAGIRYSSARPHRLIVIGPEDDRCRDLCNGHDIVLFRSSDKVMRSEKSDPAWIQFVESHWRQDRIGLLSARTALPFEDVSEAALERIGRLYLALDEARSADDLRLLALVQTFMDAEPPGVFGCIHRDLARVLRERLTEVFSVRGEEMIQSLWTYAADLWKRSEGCRSVIWPAVRIALMRVSQTAPARAAHMALAVAKDPLPNAAMTDHDALLMHVLAALQRHINASEAASDPEVTSLVNMWRSQRPDLLTQIGLTAVDA